MPGSVSAPKTHSLVSNIRSDIWENNCVGDYYKYPMKNILRRTKFHLENKSKVLSGSLTDISACVGFCTSSQQEGVKYQLWYLKKKLWSGVSINNPWTIYYEHQISGPLGIYGKGMFRAFNWLMCLGGFLHLKPTAGCQMLTSIKK